LAAIQQRKTDEMRSKYKHKVCRLQKEVDELRQPGTSSAEDHQQSTTSITPPTSQLRLYIDSLEKQEDRHMKDQLKLVKDFGRRLERIEDIGCSYFKPRAARCRIQDELFARLNKGQLYGVVKKDHLCQVAILL